MLDHDVIGARRFLDDAGRGGNDIGRRCVHLAIVVDDAARARTAADAAALAGAAGEPAARDPPSATVPSFSRSSARGAVYGRGAGRRRQAQAEASASTVWVRSSG